MAKYAASEAQALVDKHYEVVKDKEVPLTLTAGDYYIIEALINAVEVNLVPLSPGISDFVNANIQSFVDKLDNANEYIVDEIDPFPIHPSDEIIWD